MFLHAQILYTNIYKYICNVCMCISYKNKYICIHTHSHKPNGKLFLHHKKGKEKIGAKNKEVSNQKYINFN